MLKHFPAAWRKALRDLWLNKARSFLVILAISIGIFGLGLVTNSYAILVRKMDKNYMQTNPAAATILTTPLDDKFLQSVKDLPQIEEVEARRMVVGRVQVGPDEWKNIWLFVVNDFYNLRLDKFFPESGKYPPQEGEILLERAALKVVNAQIGQNLSIKIPDGPTVPLRFTGVVHAPGLAPAWMEGFAYGYITRGTLVQLGSEPALNELKVSFTDKNLDQSEVHVAAADLKGWMETQGYPVSRIDVPKPGKHPHATQMATLLFLLEAFGLVALLLSAVLVANMISALLSQQIRQIGVMKAVGASNRQVTGIYYGMVLMLGLAGLAIGLPLAIIAGRIYAEFAASMLNFEIFSYAIPHQYLLLQIVIGLLVPLVAASFPILRGSRISVREAISDYGIQQKSKEATSFIHLLRKITNRPFILSLRNTFRQQGRLILTLGTLALGGAGFIVAMNVSASMNYSVDSKFDAQKYDIQMTFARLYPEREIETLAKSVTGVKDVETWGSTYIWGSAYTVRVMKDGTESNRFNLNAPPANTDLITALPLVEGRWLKESDSNAVVINHALLALQPDIKVGNTIVLRIAGKENTWRVVGVVQELMGVPGIYMTRESLNKTMQWGNLASSLVVVSDKRDAENIVLVTRQLENKFSATGFEVSNTMRLVDSRKQIEDHLLILASFLVLMSILVLLVGGLGLASTMGINVLERTREIGVMRAIGASTESILGIILTEGAIIGAISWLLSLVISWPASIFVSNTFGMTFFDAPLRFAFSFPGIFIWLVISIVFAALASLYPAWNATQLTVRQILAYE